MKNLLACAVLLSGAGCMSLDPHGEGTAPEAAARAQDADTPAITFALEACFGSCPVFKIVLAPDGYGRFKGRFIGQQFTRASGLHTFEVSPQELAAFAERLAPFRPRGAVRYDQDNCSVPVFSDAPAITVEWEGKTGDSLFWYLGCEEPDLMQIEPALYEAWRVLPIHDLVGESHR